MYCFTYGCTKCTVLILGLSQTSSDSDVFAFAAVRVTHRQVEPSNMYAVVAMTVDACPYGSTRVMVLLSASKHL